MKEDVPMALEASLMTDAGGLHPAEGPAAWRGPDLSGKEDWVYPLSARETVEVERLVATLRRSGKPRDQITREDVRLDALAPPNGGRHGIEAYGLALDLVAGLTL